MKVLKEADGILGEYIYLIRSIEKYRNTYELIDAIQLGVTDCLNRGILENYLNEKKKEVVRMFAQEFDFEKYEKVIMEEAREEGMQKGLQEGREVGLQEGREVGRDEGVLLAAKVYKMKLSGSNEQQISEALDIPINLVKKILD